MTITATARATHGMLSAVKGSTATYTPAAGLNGMGAFSIVASDATANSPRVRVQITGTANPSAGTTIANQWRRR